MSFFLEKFDRDVRKESDMAPVSIFQESDSNYLMIYPYPPKNGVIDMFQHPIAGAENTCPPPLVPSAKHSTKRHSVQSVGVQ